MSTPEPVDEEPAAAVETRGGDHLSDAIPALLHPGEFILPHGDVRSCGHLGADCDCGDE